MGVGEKDHRGRATGSSQPIKGTNVGVIYVDVNCDHVVKGVFVRFLLCLVTHGFLPSLPYYLGGSGCARRAVHSPEGAVSTPVIENPSAQRFGYSPPTYFQLITLYQ